MSQTYLMENKSLTDGTPWHLKGAQMKADDEEHAGSEGDGCIYGADHKRHRDAASQGKQARVPCEVLEGGPGT